MADPPNHIDTAAAIKRLVSADVPQEQAAEHVRLLSDTLTDNFATRADIERLQLSVDASIAHVRSDVAEVRSEIGNLKTRITEKIGDLESRLSDKAFDALEWSASMQVGTILAILAAVKLP